MASEQIKRQIVKSIISEILSEEEEASASTPASGPTELSLDEIIQKIKDTKGAFFTVTFVKRTDGTTRTMNARFGVKKYLKGGELPYDPIAKGLLPVFDMQKNAYRMINTDTLIGAKIGNEQYIVK